MWNSEEKLGQVEEHPCGCVRSECLWIKHMAKVQWRKRFWHRNSFLDLAFLLLDPLMLSSNLQHLCLWDPFFCTSVLKSQRLQPAIRGKDITGIFSTKCASAQITLQIKRFTYKCAFVIELIAPFLRVINKQAGKGELELLRSTQLPNGSGHLLFSTKPAAIVPKGPLGIAEVKSLQR